uniref:Uncharacterized protein n=1 Tax=Romanomermis culicivorax TaxID=13658 RepID=A0A915JVD4_ROMCU
MDTIAQNPSWRNKRVVRFPRAGQETHRSTDTRSTLFDPHSKASLQRQSGEYFDDELYIFHEIW